MKDDLAFPGEAENAGEIDRMIFEASRRPAGAPFPHALASRIRSQLSTLRQQQTTCEQPLTDEADAQRQIAALLPSAAVLDRLLRYERHAQRSLKQSLETLELLRGERVSVLAARLTCDGAGGASVEVASVGNHLTG